MNKKHVRTLASVARYTARYFLLALSVLTLLFALVSGSEDYGGGIQGILKNSPNALPWLLLLVVLFVAWKWELYGGILLVALGLGLTYFFNFRGPNFFMATFVLTLSITALGTLFLLSWYLRRKM